MYIYVRTCIKAIQILKTFGVAFGPEALYLDSKHFIWAWSILFSPEVFSHALEYLHQPQMTSNSDFRTLESWAIWIQGQCLNLGFVFRFHLSLSIPPPQRHCQPFLCHPFALYPFPKEVVNQFVVCVIVGCLIFSITLSGLLFNAIVSSIGFKKRESVE